MCPSLVWGSCVPHPGGATVSLSLCIYIYIPAPRLVWTPCWFPPPPHVVMSSFVSTLFLIDEGRSVPLLLSSRMARSRPDAHRQTCTQLVPPATFNTFSLITPLCHTLTVTKPIVNVNVYLIEEKFSFLISDYLCRCYFASGVIVTLLPLTVV